MTIIDGNPLHVEVNSKGARGVYQVPINSLDRIYEWKCPVCPFRCQDDNKRTCQKLADAHQCPFGWCPIPFGGQKPIKV